MRFIVFYNDHPKVKDYSLRVWHLFQTHPNFLGEMTHAAFIRHYRLNPDCVSSIGNVFFNQKSGCWEIDKLKVAIKIKPERWKQDETLILNTMNKLYQKDLVMINFSLKEQELEAVYRAARRAGLSNRDKSN